MAVCSRRTLLAWAAGLTIMAAGGGAPALAATEQQAQDMVAKAIALYDQQGEAALGVFNQGSASGFQDGEVYVVVQSRGPDAQVLAHAANPKLVGTALKDLTDANGLTFGEMMSTEATAAGSWFTYSWADSTTGDVRPKKSWAVLHKDLVFIAGIYLPQ